MNIFGSSKKSTTNNQTTYETDNRAVFGDSGQLARDGGTILGASAISAGGSVYQTDGGAFQVVDDVIGKAFASSKDQTSQAFTLMGQQSDALAMAYQDAKGQGANKDKILMLALGGLALVAVFALRKGKA